MITSGTRRSTRAAAAAAGLVAALVAAPQPTVAASADSAIVYVALGDSYSAGSGVWPQAPVDKPSICLRSSVNYPSLIAAKLKIERFTDVTCGAAESTAFAGPQDDPFGPDPAPQFDALTPDTTLVTVGIGGNDIGLVELSASCVNLLPKPHGNSCAAAQQGDGHDKIGEAIEAFAPTYGTVIAEIRKRAPRAQIVLVGYPTSIQPNGCFPQQPLWPEDANYIQSKIDQLNKVMADQAARHGAAFVSLAASTVGHDACAAPSKTWLVGLVPTVPDGFVPLHPNAGGHRNAARQILSVI